MSLVNPIDTQIDLNSGEVFYLVEDEHKNEFWLSQGYYGTETLLWKAICLKNQMSATATTPEWAMSRAKMGVW